jgi:hypothetical protein
MNRIEVLQQACWLQPRENESESAPVPITGNRGSNLDGLALDTLGVGVDVGLGRIGDGDTGLLGVDVVLNPI